MPYLYPACLVTNGCLINVYRFLGLSSCLLPLSPWIAKACPCCPPGPRPCPGCAPAWAGSSFLAAPQLWPVLGWAGNEIAVSGVGGGSCSHSLRPAHSSVRLIGPEWRHKRPPTDTPRLVIKLQAFVLLSVAFAPSLPACLGSSPPPTQPSLPLGSAHTP